MPFRTFPARLFVLAVVAAAFGWTRDVSAQGPFQYQYAAKVVCGTPRGGVPLVTQAYATSINVNNPSDSLTLYVRKRLVITFPPGFQIPQAPLKLFNDSLLPTFALMTD